MWQKILDRLGLVLAVITGIVFVLGGITAAGIEYHDYKTEVLPRLAMIETKVLFKECRDECETNCKKSCIVNRAPGAEPQTCNCDYCLEDCRRKFFGDAG